MSVQSFNKKVMALDELFDSESTSHKWSQSCVSRNIQIDLSVAHHTKILHASHN
jgi:hypothetical protein